MIAFGRYNRLKVAKKVDFGFYLTDGSEPILLPGKYAPPQLAVGDDLDVFVYRDSEDRPIATTLKPRAQVGDIVKLRVLATTPVGAFLDWGLEKDLLVPFKEQPHRMEAGKDYVVIVKLDELTGRIIASSRFGTIAKGNPAALRPGQEVKLIVYDTAPLGFKVLIDRAYLGFLYQNEIFQTVTIGDHLTGYIVKIRPDRKIDVRLRKPGYAAVLDLTATVIDALSDAGGFLPLNAASSPEAIRDQFNMSKKVFKQTIGNLYKARRITIADDGIRLVAANDTSPDHR
ncbi:MAG: S1-like domain-containing RNA-binding protein [Victivallales bacterium]|nr:S1-like domain-containing RNA-binding protein [Victivallales bacterium]